MRALSLPRAQRARTGLADLVRRRQVTLTELLEAARERVQTRNAAGNASRPCR